LSEDVKKAVVDYLVISNGQMTSGVASLKDNGVHGCDATANDGTVTRTILVWHIATTLCEHHLADAHDREDDTVRTAFTLSRYWLHLLASAPNLLPDHSSESEYMLDRTLDKPSMLLEKVKKLESRCEELMKYNTHDGDDGDEESHVKQGAQLVRRLIDDIPEMKFRWKVRHRVAPPGATRAELLPSAAVPKACPPSHLRPSGCRKPVWLQGRRRRSSSSSLLLFPSPRSLWMDDLSMAAAVVPGCLRPDPPRVRLDPCPRPPDLPSQGLGVTGHGGGAGGDLGMAG